MNSDDNRILVVSDDESVARYLADELINNFGYDVTIVSFSKAAASRNFDEPYPVVIVSYNEFSEVVQQCIQEFKRTDQECVIIGFTKHDPAQLSRETARLGMYEVLGHPLQFDKLSIIIKKGLEMRLAGIAHRRQVQGLKEQNDALLRQNTLLAKRIEESAQNLTRLYEDLRQTYMRTIKVLAHAIDARDHYTHSHSQNVARFAVIIAEELKMSTRDIETLRDASELHDLGKIGIEDSILLKPAELTAEEWLQIKKHPLIGAQILEPLTFLGTVIDLVRQHHEHYDGTGYPEGRSADQILLGARILHLADAYESMITARSYRKIPLTKEEAIAEIKTHNGSQFDPLVVKAFLRAAETL